LIHTDYHGDRCQPAAWQRDWFRPARRRARRQRRCAPGPAPSVFGDLPARERVGRAVHLASAGKPQLEYTTRIRSLAGQRLLDAPPGLPGVGEVLHEHAANRQQLLEGSRPCRIAERAPRPARSANQRWPRRPRATMRARAARRHAASHSRSRQASRSGSAGTQPLDQGCANASSRCRVSFGCANSSPSA
jgi:hypothetical protein